MPAKFAKPLRTHQAFEMRRGLRKGRKRSSTRIGRRLNRHHQVQTARPQPVEPDPQQAVDGAEPETPGALPTKDIQLTVHGDYLQFQFRTATKPPNSTERTAVISVSMPATTRQPMPKSQCFPLLRSFDESQAVNGSPQPPPDSTSRSTRLMRLRNLRFGIVFTAL
jgi:hypothetical protein